MTSPPDFLAATDPELPAGSALDTAPVVADDFQAHVAQPLLVTFQATSCHFAGRGAAALLALCQALDAGGEIILPTLVCPSVPLACMMGGLMPVFVDVHPTDYTLDPLAVAAALTDRTLAIIAVHLYGHPCDMQSLRALADQAGVLLIEDCAQSLGQLDGDTWLGNVGDAALLSFHPSKILPAAGGGAMLLRGSAADLGERVAQAIAAFPEESALSAAEQQELTRRGNAILNTARLDPEVAPRYRTLMGDLAAGIPVQISSAQLWGIEREWETLDRVIPQRELRARRYAALLSEPLLQHPVLRGDAVPLFRYTLRPTVAGELGVRCIWHCTEALRQAGLHASNLYYPAHALFGERGEFPVAEGIGRSLLNLWLDRSATAETMLQVRRVLTQVLRRTNFGAAPRSG